MTRGLPTPNLFAGEHNFHSCLEWVSVQDMEKAVDVLVNLCCVWEEHAVIGFDPAAGFVMKLKAGALATVNGQACHEAVLRNGDEISIGSHRLCTSAAFAIS